MNKKAIRGKYISLEKIIWKNEGGVVLASIIFSRPLPIETAKKICGIIPMSDAIKKLLTLTLKIVGKRQLNCQGTPPINR